MARIKISNFHVQVGFLASGDRFMIPGDTLEWVVLGIIKVPGCGTRILVKGVKWSDSAAQRVSPSLDVIVSRPC